MATLRRADPVGLIVKNMLPAGTGGTANAVAVGYHVVRVNVSRTSTATSNLNWINPEDGTIVARVSVAIQGSNGTGTIDIGRSDNGTGSSVDWFTAATLAAGYRIKRTFQGTAAASFGSGTISDEWKVLGPGGTGTNNSIVGRLADTTTSTMGTLNAVIEYFLLQ